MESSSFLHKENSVFLVRFSIVHLQIKISEKIELFHEVFRGLCYKNIFLFWVKWVDYQGFEAFTSQS